ncbi:MAG: hypothetical protein AAB587_00350 [Patescibacteria group bacterium]
MSIREEFLKQVLTGKVVRVRGGIKGYCLISPFIVALFFPEPLGLSISSLIEFLKKWNCRKGIIEIRIHTNKKPLEFEVFLDSNPHDIVKKMDDATASIVSMGRNERRENLLLRVMTFRP